MRIALRPVILVLLLPSLLCQPGCDDGGGGASTPVASSGAEAVPAGRAPASGPATMPSLAEATRRLNELSPYAVPTTTATTNAATAPAMSPAATARVANPAAATTRAADPLATPESATRHLLEAMRSGDVEAVREMLIEPPPRAQLAPEVAAVAKQMSGGASVEVVDSRVFDSVATVVFRTHYAEGRADVAPMVFIRRYDRWKAVIGQLNAKRYTETEKSNVLRAMEWGAVRVTEVRRGATTAPSTAPAPAAAAAADAPAASPLR